MSTIAVDVEGAVAVVRLRRPEVHNALDPETVAALLAALERIAADDAIDAVVLIGGADAFSTGEDLRVAATMDRAAFAAQVQELQRLATLLRTMRQPVIAAVGGYAYGAGLEIAVNCDVRIAAPNAQFATPEVDWGLTLTNGSSVLLRRLIGDGWARELLLLGRVVDAELAERIGLVTRVVPAEELEASALEAARTVAAASAQAVGITKALLNAEHGSWEELVTAELDAVVEAFDSERTTERLAAFRTRKEPAA